MKQFTTYLLVAIAVAGIVFNIINLNTIADYKRETSRLYESLKADQPLLEQAKSSVKNYSDLMHKAALSLNDANEMINQLQLGQKYRDEDLTVLWDVIRKHHISIDEIARGIAKFDDDSVKQSQ